MHLWLLIADRTSQSGSRSLQIDIPKFSPLNTENTNLPLAYNFKHFKLTRRKTFCLIGRQLCWISIAFGNRRRTFLMASMTGNAEGPTEEVLRGACQLRPRANCHLTSRTLFLLQNLDYHPRHLTEWFTCCRRAYLLTSRLFPLSQMHFVAYRNILGH